MSRRLRNFGRGAFPLAGVAAAGAVAGHFIGYRIAFAGSPQRHAILIETGHGYLVLAFRVVAIVAAAAGAVAFRAGYARTRERGTELPDVRATATCLAVLQLSAFVGLEFFERVLAGVPLHHVLLPALAAGLVAQIAIAGIGAALLAVLYRVGETAGSVIARECEDGASRSPFRTVRGDSGRWFVPFRPARGPPVAVPLLS